jgi:ammonia channel protein AmtB
VTYMRGAVIGLVALAACAGCATGTRSAVIGSNGAASPATVETQNSCEGWYNAVAGVCDSLGD